MCGHVLYVLKIRSACAAACCIGIGARHFSNRHYSSPFPGSRMQRRQERNLAAQAVWREKASGSSILGCTRSGRLCRPSEQVFRVDWPCVQRPKADLRVNLKYPALELRAQNQANLYMYRSLMELR